MSTLISHCLQISIEISVVWFKKNKNKNNVFEYIWTFCRVKCDFIQWPKLLYGTVVLKFDTRIRKKEKTASGNESYFSGNTAQIYSNTKQYSGTSIIVV